MPAGVYERTKKALASIRKAARNKARRKKVGLGRARHWKKYRGEELKRARGKARIRKISESVKAFWSDEKHRAWRIRAMKSGMITMNKERKNRKIFKSMTELAATGFFQETHDRHRNGVGIVARKLRRQGFRVFTCYDGIPDLIAVRRKELVFGEVTKKPPRTSFARKAKKYDGKEKIWTEVVWYDLEGNIVLQK